METRIVPKMTSLTLTVSKHEESRFTEIKRKLFQKDFSKKKKSHRIAEKPFYAYYEQTVNNKAHCQNKSQLSENIKPP